MPAVPSIATPEIGILPFPPSPTTLQFPAGVRYFSIVLTYRCPYRCSYCTNRYGRAPRRNGQELTGQEWLDFLHRLDTRGLPVIIDGGEPGRHADFIELVAELVQRRPVTILTTLAFDLGSFVSNVDPLAMPIRDGRAPIQVSYHPEQFSLQDIILRVQFMIRHGFPVQVVALRHPRHQVAIGEAQKAFKELDIDFRTEPFLGIYQGRFHGAIETPEACSLITPRHCACVPGSLLAGPDGWLFTCHHHLYHHVFSIGHVSHQRIHYPETPGACSCFGHCNPIDMADSLPQSPHGHQPLARITLRRVI